MKDLSTHPLRQVEALDLLKVLGEHSAPQAGRSVHLPEAIAFLAQAVTGAAVHSDAVVGAVLEASQVVIPLEAFPAGAEDFMAAVAAVDNSVIGRGY